MAHRGDRLLLAAVVLLLVSLLWPCLAFGQSTDAPVIRTTVSPSDGAVIGQAVSVRVTVLFAGDMIRPPFVALPETPGAQIFRFETQGVTVRDRIEGQDYVGQSFEFTLYPRRGGSIAYPGGISWPPPGATGPPRSPRSCPLPPAGAEPLPVGDDDDLARSCGRGGPGATAVPTRPPTWRAGTAVRVAADSPPDRRAGTGTPCLGSTTPSVV